jgi:hypothetical protein
MDELVERFGRPHPNYCEVSPEALNRYLKEKYGYWLPVQREIHLRAYSSPECLRPFRMVTLRKR